MVFPEHVSDTMANGAASWFIEAMLPRTNSPLAVFVTVTALSTDLPSRTSPKGIRRSSAGATESVTLMSPTAVDAPVPLRETVTDAFPGSLLGMLKLSVKVPVTVGSNVIVKAQVAAGAMV